MDCTSLTSVKFEGTISSGNIWGPFDGDLLSKYLARDGGPGTYKRFEGSDVWKKQ